ncbi:MAG TPA: RsmE family RNA methyltransferase [Rickettsiales bacterium]|nr:RsmE family RNA methyltransferase [Rickettsiales bacterium]
MLRIFLKEDLEINKEIKITDKLHHYIVNVMRCKINDKISIVNGKDGEFSAQIIFINNKYCILRIEKKTKDYIKENFLGLIFAPIQKIDLVLKSATELGTTDFFPINTDFTNKNILKINKFEGNIIEAIEQSERLDFPNIHKICSLIEILEKLKNEDSLIFFCEERTGQNSIKEILTNINISNKKIYTLIGPEGGFSNKEKELINSYKNIISVSLGDTILRTETATIAIISILKNFF